MIIVHTIQTVGECAPRYNISTAIIGAYLAVLPCARIALNSGSAGSSGIEPICLALPRVRDTLIPSANSSSAVAQ